MEIEQYLQELLRDDSRAGHEDLQTINYFDLIASSIQGSLLSFDSVKILPPLLSEADKQVMREYRRKAVNLEQKLFEARREKYSNLILQVVELLDKFEAAKVSKKDKSTHPKQQQAQSHQSVKMRDLSVETSDNSHINTIGASISDKNADQPLKILSKNDKRSPDKARRTDHQILKDEDNSLVPVFQKPKIFNSSSPGNKSKASNTSRQSHVPSVINVNKSVGTSRSHTPGRESILSSSSTLKGSDQSLLRETLENRQDLDPSDSLASTVLSMAFTESSFASQQSTAVGPRQPSRSAQRQLNMDVADNNVYQSYYHKVNPLTSTPNELQQAKKTSAQNVTTKKTTSSSSSRTISSSKINTKTISEQDKALEKLELMKKKLLEEKEKQMILLRQQELARIRKSKDKPGNSKHDQDMNRNMYSPGYIASRPDSDMYSIPERSFEGTASFTQGDQIHDIESASDKENNAYNTDLQQNLHPCNNDYGMPYGNEEEDDRNELEERYSSEIESRPISVHSKDVTNRDHRRSSLYVRQEFQKQFEFEMSKGHNGKDKFSILTAYAKGFMTRRVLQAEKVQAIVKTIKDTSEFLVDISKEGTTSYQDKTLQQRVQAQLVAAKSKLYDIFFTIPITERMAYVEHSRNATREREDRMNAKSTTTKQMTRKLSAATMKAMQRRQLETNNNNNSDVKKTTTESLQGKRRSMDTRALKPVQSIKSPQVPEKGRSQVKRRSLASPLARRSLGKKNFASRPSTAVGTRPASRKSPRSSTEAADKPTRLPRTSLDGRQQMAKRPKPNINTESNSSRLPVKKRESLGGGLTYRVSKEDSGKVLPKSRPSTAK